MRTREEIKKEQFWTNGIGVVEMSQILSLEVLLDVRDLLAHPPHDYIVQLDETEIQDLKNRLSTPVLEKEVQESMEESMGLKDSVEEDYCPHGVARKGCMICWPHQP